MSTSVKAQVDAVRKRASDAYDLTLPLAKAREAFAQILYGKPYSAALAAEKAGVNPTFSPQRSRAATMARRFGVYYRQLWGAVQSEFGLFRSPDTWTFADVVNAVASHAVHFDFGLAPTALNDAISVACFGLTYAAVIDAETSGTLEPLRLPPRFIKLASDSHGLSASRFRRAFSSVELDFRAPSTQAEETPPRSSMSSETFDWCRQRYAAGELDQLDDIDAYYFITQLGDEGMDVEAAAIADAARGLDTEDAFLDALADHMPEQNARWRDLKMQVFRLGRPIAAAEVAEDLYDKGDFRNSLDLAIAGAARGSRMAASMAGYIYETGAGVPMDLLEAARWYSYGATLDDEGCVGTGPEINAIAGVWQDDELIEELSEKLNHIDRKQLLKIMGDSAGNTPKRLREEQR